LRALTSLSGLELLLLCVGGAAAFAAFALLVLHLTLHPQRREGAGATAAAYMTVLGSLFAILTGFLINSEYATLRQAQNVIGTEVASAGQLAYASASLPPPDTALVQESLAGYLGDVSGGEWRMLSRDPGGRSAAADDLALLSRQVFDVGTRPYAPSAAVDAMQGALASVTESRRQRIVIASQELPLPLFALSAITGAALIVGAMLVTLRAGPRFAFVAAGIVLVVGLDLAAILAISAPFAGPFPVSTIPIEQLAREIAEGQYLPWVRLG
jgi:hypothetical protein